MSWMKKTGTVTTVIIALNIIAWMTNIFAGGGSFFGLFLSGGGYAKEFGELTYQAVILGHEWWRLLVCGYLHLGIFHLAFNVLALFGVGSRMERRMGAVKYALVYHVGLVITAFLWCLIFRESSMVGASLGIFVLFGIYLVRKRRDDSPNEYWLSRREWNYFLSYAVIGCVLGVTTTVAHGIGLCVGMMGCMLSERRDKNE